MTEDTPPSRRLPRATYRLQLHAGFTFVDARRVVPYLDALGVSDLYLSPIFAANAGSTHGYDVVDPTTVAPVLGGIREFRALAAEVRSRGMGLLLDIVPNHLGVGTEANRWWMDVLRHGRGSRYATFFDIDWAPPDPALRDRILLPVLGAELDDVMRRGELTLEHDADGLYLRYFDSRFPLDPETALDLDARAVQQVNDERATPERGDRLRALLEAQHYMLTYWRTGGRAVNYRRFFAIDSLAGVRVEDEHVFDATHETVLRLVGEGSVTGLRIDHIDGLADPGQYLQRLRDRGVTYSVVEKILAYDEELPPTWPTEGTTGYEFMNDVVGLLVDSANVARFDATYRAFTGREEPFADIAYRGRRAVIDGPLAQQIDAAASALHAALGTTGPDVDPIRWSEAVRAVLACLPVYRLYTNERGPDPRSPQHLERAAADARARLPELDEEALDAVIEALAAPASASAVRAVMRLQQLMPAIQAKGVEDTAIYRHVPLLALDEVGSDPERHGLDAAAFHERSARRLEGWPGSLLATATHDHKRGEGIRARLAALSELPDEWEDTLEQWSSAARGLLESPPGPDSPSRHDEYLLYQTILGAWPTDIASVDREELVARLTEYVVKATREAGERTDWLDPDVAYEAALGELVAAATSPEITGPLLEAPGSLGRRAAWLGTLNALAQTLLKLAAPGVPDVYQGTELWDLSLVDPDNRRPVDYEQRAATLERLAPALQDTSDGDRRRAELTPALLRDSVDGAVKLFVLARGLGLRRRLPELFARGAYRPLTITGQGQDHVVAFERHLGNNAVIAVAALQPATLLGRRAVAEERWTPDWGDTAIELGEPAYGLTYVDAFTGAILEGHAGALDLSGVLDVLPIAFLERRTS